MVLEVEYIKVRLGTPGASKSFPDISKYDSQSAPDKSQENLDCQRDHLDDQFHPGQ